MNYWTGSKLRFDKYLKEVSLLLIDTIRGNLYSTVKYSGFKNNSKVRLPNVDSLPRIIVSMTEGQ